MDDGRRASHRAAAVAAFQEHTQALVLPRWPVFALAEPDEEGFLAGATENERGVVAIRLDYRTPDSAQRLMVQTQPSEGRVLNLVNVRGRLLAEDGAAPVSLRVMTAATGAGRDWVSTEMLVDGQPHPALTQSHGALTTWQVHAFGVVAVVAAWQTPLDRVSLTRVADLAPFKRRRALVVGQWLSRHPPS